MLAYSASPTLFDMSARHPVRHRGRHLFVDLCRRRAADLSAPGCRAATRRRDRSFRLCRRVRPQRNRHAWINARATPQVIRRGRGRAQCPDRCGHRNCNANSRVSIHGRPGDAWARSASAALGGRGLGVLLAIFALPNVLPSAIPFGNIATGIPPVIFTLQLMLARRDRLMLPHFIAPANRSARPPLKALIPRVAAVLSWFERLLKPRLAAMVSPTRAERIYRHAGRGDPRDCRDDADSVLPSAPVTRADAHRTWHDRGRRCGHHHRRCVVGRRWASILLAPRAVRPGAPPPPSWVMGFLHCTPACICRHKGDALTQPRPNMASLRRKSIPIRTAGCSAPWCRRGSPHSRPRAGRRPCASAPG